MTSIGYVCSCEQFAPSQLVEFGQAAEQAGFDMIWSSDHFHPWMDNQGHAGQAWVLLAALGQRLQRIPFGTGVTAPTYRYNPAIVAQAFASLGELYPGRVFLGVGTGEALNEKPASGEWGDYDERIARLEEAIVLIRQLWSGEWIDHKGKYYTVRDARLYTLPSQPIPIFMAASGDESLRQVGQYGDGLISEPESLQDETKRTAFEEGARQAGRNPQDIPVISELFVHAGTQDEAKELAKLWRFLPNAWTEYVDDPDPRSILKKAEREVKPEQVLEKWTVSPDPQVHIAKIKELIGNNIQHIFIHSAAPDQRAFIEWYGREVLPHIQHETMRPTALVDIAQAAKEKQQTA